MAINTARMPSRYPPSSSTESHVDGDTSGGTMVYAMVDPSPEPLYILSRSVLQNIVRLQAMPPVVRVPPPTEPSPSLGGLFPYYISATNNAAVQQQVPPTTLGAFDLMPPHSGAATFDHLLSREFAASSSYGAASDYASIGFLRPSQTDALHHGNSSGASFLSATPYGDPLATTQAPTPTVVPLCSVTPDSNPLAAAITLPQAPAPCANAPVRRTPAARTTRVVQADSPTRPSSCERCHHARKRCDVGRPCTRCQRYGLQCIPRERCPRSTHHGGIRAVTDSEDAPGDAGADTDSDRGASSRGQIGQIGGPKGRDFDGARPFLSDVQNGALAGAVFHAYYGEGADAGALAVASETVRGRPAYYPTANPPHASSGNETVGEVDAHWHYVASEHAPGSFDLFVAGGSRTSTGT